MIDPIAACLWLLAASAVVAVTGAGAAWGIDRAVRAPPGAGVCDVLGPGWERWLARFGVGAAAWMMALFALAALGALRAPAIAALAVALPALGLAAILRSRGAAANVDPQVAPPGRRLGAGSLHRAAHLGVATVLALTVAALVARALVPDVSWDADVYHLTVPRIYLEHGGFARIPFNVYSNWPLGVELLFAAALALRDFVLAKLLHLAFGIATALLAWRLAVLGEISRTSGAGMVAAALFLANPVVLAEATVAYVDLASACFLLLGLGALHAHLESVHPGGDDLASGGSGATGRSEATARGRAAARSALLLCALCAGALCAIKVSGVLAAACLGATLAVEAARLRRPPRVIAGAVVTVAGGAALFGLPWLVKSWVLTGNPVYPFFFERLGGPEWSAALSARLAEWQRSIGMGREPLDHLLLPLRVALDGGDGYARFDGRISPLWLALVPLSLWTARHDRLSRRALVLAGATFVVWAATSQQMRFLVPTLGLLSVAAARGLVAATTSRRAAAARRLGASLAALPPLLAAGVLAVYAWPWMRVAVDNAPVLVRHYPEARHALVDPAHRFVNERLPPDARLLMLDHNRGFHLERDFLADSFFEASQIAEAFRDDDPAAAERRLRELGVTHVLVERRERGADYPAGLRAAVARARPVYRSPDGRVVVAELDRRSGP